MWQVPFDSLLQTFVASMLPIGALRLGIPLGILVLDLHWFPVLIISFIGNLAPVLPILLLLNWVPRVIPYFPSWVNKIWLFQNKRVVALHGKYSSYVSVKNRESRNLIILILLVAVPLPFTGVWTGCLVAWILGLPLNRAFPPIALGALIAGLLVTMLVLGPFDWLANALLIDAV